MLALSGTMTLRKQAEGRRLNLPQSESQLNAMKCFVVASWLGVASILTAAEIDL